MRPSTPILTNITLIMLFVCVAPSFAATPGDPADMEAFRENVNRGVVLVDSSLGQGNHQIGSGFVIDGDGTVITSLHVVNKSVSVKVRFYKDAGRYAYGWVALDQTKDLAVLKPLKEKPKKLGPLPLPDQTESDPANRTEVVLFGHPTENNRTEEWDYHEGKIKNNARSTTTMGLVYVLDIAAYPGFSGGPVVASPGQPGGGRVLGVMRGGYGDGTAWTNYVVPHRYIADVLKSGLGKAVTDFNGSDYPQADQSGVPGSLLKSFTHVGPRPGDFRKTDADPKSVIWGFAKKSRLVDAVKQNPNFANGIPVDQIENLITDNNLIELYNARYRVGFFVPAGSSVKETFDAASDSITCRVRTPNSGTDLTLYVSRTQRLAVPTEERLMERVDQLEKWYFENLLRRRLVLISEQAMPPIAFYQPPYVASDLVQVNSMEPLVHPEDEEAEGVFLYHPARPGGQALMASFGVSRDTFVAAHFSFDPPPFGQMPVFGVPFGFPAQQSPQFMEQYLVLTTLYSDP